MSPVSPASCEHPLVFYGGVKKLFHYTGVLDWEYV